MGPDLIVAAVAVGGFILSGFAAWKAHISDRSNSSAALVEAETLARTDLAINLRQDITNCRQECISLREQLAQERQERSRLEDKVDAQAHELRTLKQRLRDLDGN